MDNTIAKNQQIRLLIGGTHSGVGKTTITAGLALCFQRRGLSVQCFKIGPDYLDAALLTRCSQRPCYNLDRWLTSEKYMDELIEKTDADILLIEGVMGLFDHAEIASYIIRYQIKPVLVFSAAGMGNSAAALVSGFDQYHANVKLHGVIANDCRSKRHHEIMQTAIDNDDDNDDVHSKSNTRNYNLFLGSLSRDSSLEFPSRHLGIHIEPSQILLQLPAIEQAIESGLAIDHIIETSRFANQMNKNRVNMNIDQHQPTKRYNESTPGISRNEPAKTEQKKAAAYASKSLIVRSRVLAYAWDEAFYFYYPDNLELLAAAGFELIAFSPLHSSSLPKDTALIYIGGGYPENHCRELEANQQLIHQLRTSTAAVYGECGGFMYLGQTITDLQGKTWEMTGRLPVQMEMLSRFEKLNYVEIEFCNDCLIGRKKWLARGHEYHYSRMCDFSCKKWEGENTEELAENYLIQERRTKRVRKEGLQMGNVLGSYVHIHFASQRKIPEYLFEECMK